MVNAMALGTTDPSAMPVKKRNAINPVTFVAKIVANVSKAKANVEMMTSLRWPKRSENGETSR